MEKTPCPVCSGSLEPFWPLNERHPVLICPLCNTRQATILPTAFWAILEAAPGDVFGKYLHEPVESLLARPETKRPVARVGSRSRKPRPRTG